MWQVSGDLGTAPASAAMAMDHPALGFSILQNRMQIPLKQPTGHQDPSGNLQNSGQVWASPFTSLANYGGDLGALNPMPVVSAPGVLAGLNSAPGHSLDYATMQQRQLQAIPGQFPLHFKPCLPFLVLF